MKKLSTSPWRIGALLLILGIIAVALITPLPLTQLLHPTTGAQTADAAAACTSPPAGFNPATATSANLKLYGLPPNPGAKSPRYNHWLSLVKGVKKHVCDSSNEKVTHVQTPNQAQTTNPLPMANSAIEIGTNTISAGYTAHLNNGNNFQETYGQVNIPCLTGHDTNSEATLFLGLGNFSIGITDDLARGGHNVIWSNTQSSSFTIVNGYNMPCNGGNNLATFDIQINNGVANFLAEDAASGTYYSLTVTRATVATTSSWLVSKSYNVPLYNFGTLLWQSCEFSPTSTGSITNFLDADTINANSLVNKSNTTLAAIGSPDSNSSFTLTYKAAQ